MVDLCCLQTPLTDYRVSSYGTLAVCTNDNILGESCLQPPLTDYRVSSYGVWPFAPMMDLCEKAV